MDKQHSSEKHNQRTSNSSSQHDERQSPEQEPAVERGERIASGKAIARGGKEAGFVPGAQPDPKHKSKSAD